jgi:aspartyl protease family protein
MDKGSKRFATAIWLALPRSGECTLWPFVAAVMMVATSQADGQELCLTATGNTFSTEVTLNGTVAIPGIVDTGATDLTVICEEATNALRLPSDAAVQLQTASGTTTAFEVTISSVRIGPIEMRNVAALVLRQQGPCRLLIGTSFLSKLHSVVLKGLTLALVGKRAAGGAATAIRHCSQPRRRSWPSRR